MRTNNFPKARTFPSPFGRGVRGEGNSIKSALTLTLSRRERERGRRFSRSSVVSCRSAGFTLIEIIVSIVAFGILMALFIVGFAPNIVRGTDPLFSVRAAELGQSYLDEILGKRFAENSPPGNGLRCGEAGGPVACSAIGSDEGANHINFDDVDDYNALNEIPPIDSSGNARNGYDNFRVQVTVAQAQNADALTGVNNADAKRITVTVTAPNGGIFIFAAYKMNF